MNLGYNRLVKISCRVENLSGMRCACQRLTMRVHITILEAVQPESAQLEPGQLESGLLESGLLWGFAVTRGI